MLSYRNPHECGRREVGSFVFHEPGHALRADFQKRIVAGARPMHRQGFHDGTQLFLNARQSSAVNRAHKFCKGNNLRVVHQCGRSGVQFPPVLNNLHIAWNVRTNHQQ